MVARMARERRPKRRDVLKYENAINGFLASMGNQAKFNVNHIVPMTF